MDDKRAVERVGLGSPTLLLGAGVAVMALLTTAAISLGVVTGRDSDSGGKRASGTPGVQTPVGDLLNGSELPLPSLAGDTGAVGVPANTAPRPTKPVTGPSAAPDSGQIATYRGASGTMTPVAIATLAIKAGCPADSAAIATAVAMAESGGSPAAQGDTTLMDTTWDWSAGLWQIRGLRSQRDTGQLRDSVANHDPLTNASAMYAISNGCSNWSPWTTYTRGTYRSFLSLAERAVRYVQGYRESHGGRLPPIAPRDPGAPVPAGGRAGDARQSGGSRADRTSGAARRDGAGTTSKASPAAGTPARSSAAGGAAAGGGNGGSNGGSDGGSNGGYNGGGNGGSNGGDNGSAPTRTRSSTTPPKQSSEPTKQPTTLPTKLPTLLPTLPTKLPTLPGLG